MTGMSHAVPNVSADHERPVNQTLVLCSRRANCEPTEASVKLKPNSITLASSELAPDMFEAGSCQIPSH